MKSIEIASYAKINLSIDVTGVDCSGFHTVDMIMQQIAFHDDVKISFTENSAPDAGAGSGTTFDTSPEGISSAESDARTESVSHRESQEKFGISVSTNRVYLPTNEKNLAYRAAQLMIQLYGNERNGGSIEIEILKRIPVGAGLAGGSGNGAAVIHGLNALWNLDLSLTEICGICEELGSDVPFCAVGQAVMNKKLPRKICKSDIAATCVRATGRGTHIRKTTSLKKPIVLAKPRFGVSTSAAYKGIDSCEIEKRPDNDRLEKLLKERGAGMYDEFINVLENYTLKAYPAVQVLKDKMEKSPARKVLMSGSGPTVFAVFDDMQDAKVLSAELRKEKYESYWTHTTV